MKKLITAVLLLSTFFFSCNQAVKGEYATVVVDLGGSASGARAIGQNELPFLKDTHITIEANGRVGGAFVKDFPPEENRSVALRLIAGDTVRLRVKASNASGIWSGGTTFTVEDGTNAVFVKLNKTISGAQALTFSMTKTGTHGNNPLYTVNLYAGNKKVGSKNNVLLPPSFCRDAKGRIFVAYYYYESSREKADLIRYDSEGNESEKLIEKDWISSPLILASDLTTKEVYAVRSRELYKVGTGSFKLWPSVDMSHLPYNFSGINLIAAHNGQLFVFGQKNGENNSHLYVYDINLSETSFTLAHEKLNTKLSVPPTDTSYKDMFVTDDAVYLLRSDYAAVPDHGKVYSKGALIKYEYDKEDKEIDDREEFGKSDEDDENGIVLTPDTSFYGPLKFVGFNDDVLYIADDGVKFTYFNEAPRITANKNRIAAFNTSTNSLSFTDTSATWEKEEKILPQKTLLWKARTEENNTTVFDYYAVDRADSPLGSAVITSASDTDYYTDVFCFDQAGNLYVVKKAPSGYKVVRYEPTADGGYDFFHHTEAVLPGLAYDRTAIAVDVSGTVTSGSDTYNALYYYCINALNRKSINRISWKTTDDFSAADTNGYNGILMDFSVSVTALAANKDGVFVATNKSSGNDYTLKVQKYLHDMTPMASVTVGSGKTLVLWGGYTSTTFYNEAINALQIADGILYGISTKRESNYEPAFFNMSGKLLKLGNTHSFGGTAQVLYAGNASSNGSFAPYRFIALKPKKLVIASDGGYGEKGTTTAKNSNRVLIFTLDGSGDMVGDHPDLLAPDSRITFSKELSYNVSCGQFVW